MNNILWETQKEKKKKLWEKETEFFLSKIEKIRSGRISLDAVRGLVINVQGKKTPLKEVKELNFRIDNSNYSLVAETKEKVMPELIRAITNSSLGLKVVENNKGMARFVLDVISEETKKNLLKEVKNIVEEGKIAIRNIRDDLRSFIKKEKSFSQNEKKIFEKEIDKIFLEQLEKLEKAENKKKENLK